MSCSTIVHSPLCGILCGIHLLCNWAVVLLVFMSNTRMHALTALVVPPVVPTVQVFPSTSQTQDVQTEAEFFMLSGVQTQNSNLRTCLFGALLKKPGQFICI